MPLANRRDKITQIAWGLRDFAHRFGRAPEGMWLAEAAVDLETLDLLAEQGVRFTILAPSQAREVRPFDGAWRSVEGDGIDPTMAYRQHLPSGRTIDLFFYDGPIARAVAFEHLLDRGESLAERLASGFDDGRNRPQLVHIATDGESYGHHHRQGEMALAYALDHIERRGLATLTNYGEYLERHSPTHEVAIVERTAWSCAHGVGRWQRDCGCNSGGYSRWNQAWRAPLREALDWLRDALIPRYEEAAARLVVDPWAARDDYIGVILDRTSQSAEDFLARHVRRPLTGAERIELWQLLEMQRHAVLMYTSCGWFFDELSGIETVQVLQYAGRAVQMAQERFGDDLERAFRERLARAKSNLPEHGDGARIYDKWVKPANVGLERVAAHYAISALFEPYPEESTIYAYHVARTAEERRTVGLARLLLGCASFTSRITGESRAIAYGVLHFGDHTVNCGVHPAADSALLEAPAHEVLVAFERADLPEAIRQMDRYFGRSAYTLRSLFRDEQRAILDTILDATTATNELAYRQVYQQQLPLLRFLTDLGVPPPRALQNAAEFIANLDLRRALAATPLDPGLIGELIDQAGAAGVTLDATGLAYVAATAVAGLSAAWREAPAERERLGALVTAAKLARALPFEVDLWPAQNDYMGVMGRVFPAQRDRLLAGDRDALAWATESRTLGEALGVDVTEIQQALDRTPTVEDLARGLLARRRVPGATYRLQFGAHFTFADAQELLPYLSDLGVSDCYASPLFQAGAESSHGYDVRSYDTISAALGGADGFAAFAAALRAGGLGLLLDMVPNHMGIGDADNAWWRDVLENGPSSPYADYFDIDWRPATPELANKVLLPILEDQYGAVLEAGKLAVRYADGAFTVNYYDTQLPVAPRSYRLILRPHLDRLITLLGTERDEVLELQSILTSLQYLPRQTERDPLALAERRREKEIAKRRLATLVTASTVVRETLEATLATLNGVPGDSASFDLLDRLLGVQAYRLAFWRVATDEINYRRFFDINELAAIRVEHPAVFERTHRLLFDLIGAGSVTGLRIDHPDGLWDPAAYFRQLQRRAVRTWLADGGYHPDLVERVADWLEAHAADRGPAPLYVVAEKILAEGERLPDDWAIDGTTGYDFLNALNGLFVDARHRDAFDRLYRDFSGTTANFADLANATRKIVMLIALASEINALSHRLERIAERHRRYRDFTLTSLTFAIREVIACLSVYRTYIVDPADAMREFNRAHVLDAVTEARRRNPRTAAAIFDFIERILLLDNLPEFPEAGRTEVLDFVRRFQQLTGPVMAKGLEDTAFYRYYRLASLNEVGGHPAQFGLTVEEFHRLNGVRREYWPHNLLATATHDAKRGEDVRVRIDVLSELPTEWSAALESWGGQNAASRRLVGGLPAPDRNDEYLLYQTLLGAWPDDWTESTEPLPSGEFAVFRDRIVAYMHKAVREAKVHTSWFNPHSGYEQALEGFIRGILDECPDNAFLRDFRRFQGSLGVWGRTNGLAQVLLKLTAPGVPDLYQGSELWDLNLVDPDNRRPIDFARRRELLADLRRREAAAGDDRGPLVAELLDRSADGQVKLYATTSALASRRERPRLFADGAYVPLTVTGTRGEHACAFARVLGDDVAIVVAPRLVVGLTGDRARWPLGAETWGATTVLLPREWADRRWRDRFTGQIVAGVAGADAVALPLAALFAQFPLALLEALPDGAG